VRVAVATGMAAQREGVAQLQIAEPALRRMAEEKIAAARRAAT
jgi:hypothetical protein